MSSGKKIQKRTISFVLSVMMVFSCCTSNIAHADEPTPAPAAHSDLGTAQGYNLVCFNNFTTKGADIEGKAFIGGAINVKTGHGGFTFGTSSAIGANGYSLVFGSKTAGSYTVPAGYSNYRALVYKNIQSVISGKRQFSRVDAWNNEADLKTKTGIDLTTTTINGKTVSKFQAEMIEKSQDVSGYAAKSGIQVTGATFNGTAGAGGYNIYNITAANLDQLSSITLNASTDSYQIINVTGKLPSGIHLPGVQWGSSNATPELCTKILWNLSDADKILNRGTDSIYGSVLAPNATFQPANHDGNGNYVGTLIVDQFNCQDGTNCGWFEGHNYPYSGDLLCESSMTLTKTANINSSDGWNNRIYDINLTATAKSDIQYYTEPRDIILVLDRSGSMDEVYRYDEVNTPDVTSSYYITVGDDKKKVFHDEDGWYYKIPNWPFDDERIDVEFVKDGTGYTYTNASGTLDTSETYYVSTGGDIVAVTYSDSFDVWHNGFDVYDPEDDQFMIRSALPQYQFYTKVTKLDALKDAAEGFIASVQTKSPDSRVAVVSFGSNSSGATNETNGLLTLSSTNVTNINTKIEAISASGGTRSYDGLKKARDIYGADSQTDRKRMVILFTDGEPGDYGFNYNGNWQDSGFEAAAYTINQSAVLKGELDEDISSDLTFHVDGISSSYNGDYHGSVSGSGCGATVYTVGVFNDYSGTELNLVNRYMTQVATSADKYYPVTNTESMSDIFEKLSREVGTVTGATVTDVIDPKFILMKNATTPASVNDTINGGTVDYDSVNGVWKITWSNQKIGTGTTADPKWEKTIMIKAKPEFVGGNNITTNAPGSRLSYLSRAGAVKRYDFISPTVNVKSVLTVGSAQTTIFLGEKAPNSLADSCKTWTDPSVNYNWKDGAQLIADNTAFPNDRIPESSATYTLHAWFNPGIPTTASILSSGGNHVGTVQEDDSYLEEQSGTYSVNVIPGTLVIQKTIQDSDGKPVNESGRSFVFLVEGTAEAGCRAITPFYVTLTMGSGSTATKTIGGLSKGTYTIKEINSNWQYDKGTMAVTPTPAKLGYHMSGSKTDFDDKLIRAQITNTLAHNQWFGATDSVTNTFHQ